VLKETAADARYNNNKNNNNNRGDTHSSFWYQQLVPEACTDACNLLIGRLCLKVSGTRTALVVLVGLLVLLVVLVGLLVLLVLVYALEVFLKRYVLYKFTFYLLIYFLTSRKLRSIRCTFLVKVSRYGARFW